MDKRCLSSPNAPAALGPYSHAVAAGDFLFVSGQGPLAPDGSGVVGGPFENQVRQTLSNLKTILEDCGSGLDKVVKVTVFLADMSQFSAFNEIYKEYFVADCPARSCVQAARLPLDTQVEVEAIALLR